MRPALPHAATAPAPRGPAAVAQSTSPLARRQRSCLLCKPGCHRDGASALPPRKPRRAHRSLRALADQHRRDGGAHAAALADAQARIAELEAANSALSSQLSAQSLDGDALGKQEAKLGDLASLVHSQRRQLDETEVAVKHVKHQVRKKGKKKKTPHTHQPHC